MREGTVQNLLGNISRKRWGRGTKSRMKSKRRYLSSGNSQNIIGRNENSCSIGVSEEVIMGDI